MRSAPSVAHGMRFVRRARREDSKANGKSLEVDLNTEGGLQRWRGRLFLWKTPYVDASSEKKWESAKALGVHTLALLDQAVVSGASFLTTVVVGRSTSPSELGVYALGMSLLTSLF